MHRRAEFACLDAERRPEVPNPEPRIAGGLTRSLPRPPGAVPAVAGFRVVKDIGAARKRRNGIDRLERPLSKRCNRIRIRKALDLSRFQDSREFIFPESGKFEVIVQGLQVLYLESEELRVPFRPGNGLIGHQTKCLYLAGVHSSQRIMGTVSILSF